MCGIVGYVGTQQATGVLLEGLARLEYRGYDSAGVAVVRDGEIRVHKVKGKVADLAASLPKRVRGTVGIGHTRWATHGEPSDVNAHPHIDGEGRVAVVHNGIIENAADIRASLEAEGVQFRSDTDSEVLAHLIARSGEDDLAHAVRVALSSVEGTYGIAVVSSAQPDRIVVARNGSPVIIGIGEREHFVASDVAALVRHTHQVVYLADGDVAIVRANDFTTLDEEPGDRDSRVEIVSWDVGTYDKGVHAHYLRKEIFEQPDAIERALSGRLERRFATAHLGGVDLTPQEVLRIRRVTYLGCGSAYYAGLSAAMLTERLARIPSDAQAASEFRYRNPVIHPDTLYVAISQSGETLDTLRAVEEVQRKGGQVLGVVNVVGSTIARACGRGVYLHAGPEVSVASTKAFTSTLVGTALIALFLARVRDLGPADGGRLLDAFEALPTQMEKIFGLEDQIADIAARMAGEAGAFYIGRGAGFPVALEGAQKLKEVSYVHAEAHPASELKHGPLALVGPRMPTVAIVPSDDLYQKNCSTLEEIRARSGPIVAVGHREALGQVAEDVIIVPKSEPELDPVLLVVPLQLLAYHAALALGVDIDQPRNLAKSVTVE